MKKLILFIGALVLFTTIQAQTKTKKTPQERASRLSERLATKLGITDQQKKKVYNLAYYHIIKIQKARADFKDDKKARNMEVRSNLKQFDDSLKIILTADQYLKYKEMRENTKNKIKDGKDKGDKVKDKQKGKNKNGDKQTDDSDLEIEDVE